MDQSNLDLSRDLRMKFVSFLVKLAEMIVIRLIALSALWVVILVCNWLNCALELAILMGLGFDGPYL